MSQETNLTPAQTEPSQKVKTINAHLDALLGMDVRKPGSAAKLPAVIRITETLEAAGGKDFPVFPPSYAGENTGDPPRYDLNGIEWGQYEVTLSNGSKKMTPYIKSARHCTMDSPQSHGNLTEVAFMKDPRLRALVPEIKASYPRDKKIVGDSGIEEVDVLTLPHRIADFRVRASRDPNLADKAIKAFAKGDALPLLRLMPTSIIFGFWDSRAEGYQHKHSRILLTRIDASKVVPCEKHSLYSGPYSKDECAAVVVRSDELTEEMLKGSKMNENAKAWDKAMSERGFVNVPGSGLGGIFAEEIKRLALISLTDIASVFCFRAAEKADEAGKGGDGQQTAKAQEPDKDLTDAARRYLLALALLAENYPRSLGSYRLRSGCELIVSGKPEIVLLGAGGESEAARALVELSKDRELLIEVATHARAVLGIKPKWPSFQSDADSLRTFLGKDIKSEKDAEREKKAAEKAAQKAKNDATKAREKATKAADAATAAETKANLRKKDKDKTTAEEKRKAANNLSAEAEKLEKVATEAASKLGTDATQPPADSGATATSEQPLTPRA